ncbi:MAG: hypothetical protein FJ241_12285 [Nitrospira sp.]|nr:hypothetical protein [Nitrospira sp.]
MTNSHTKYPDDYQYVQLLLSGNADAWKRFYKESRKKIANYINQKYSDIFSDVIVEEICDGVQNRLMKNDYKVLCEYRGDCSFSTFVTRATDWEVKDWLRKHSNELLKEPVDTLSSHELTYKDIEPDDYLSISAEYIEVIPDEIKSLSDDLRWAFLLRYYDYFGFPLNEIRLLAKKKNVPIGSITKKIVRFLEPEGEDILRAQRDKQEAFMMRLQKLCLEVQKLRTSEQKLTTAIEEYSLYYQQKDQEKLKKLDVIRKRLLKIEEKRNTLLQNNLCVPITTPYEIIAKILDEDNISTIRSRIFLAKNQLIQQISKKFG